MEENHQSPNGRMPRACKRGRPRKADTEKSCTSRRGRKPKAASLRELLQSGSPYETQALTPGMAASYSMPQQQQPLPAQQHLQQAQYAAAYSHADPRIRRAAEQQNSYHTRTQTRHQHAAYLPTEQNVGLSASNQVLYPNISTATYTVPEKLSELASMSGQPSCRYQTRSTVTPTGTSGVPTMHHMPMSRESQTPVNAHFSNNSYQIRSPTLTAPDPMTYFNRSSRTPVSTHSRNIEQINSPAPAAGPEMSYMNRACPTPVTVYNRNAQLINSPAPTIRAEPLQYATTSGRVPVTAHYNSSHQKSPPAPTVRPEAMAFLNRPIQTPVTAHNATAQQLRYASLRPRPIRKDHKLCQTEFSMTEDEARLIKLIKSKKMNVNHIRTEMEGEELNVTYYEKPTRPDVIRSLEPSSNIFKQSLIRMFQIREALGASFSNALTGGETDAATNNDAAAPLVQLPSVEDSRYESVSPADQMPETNNNDINTINAENLPFAQRQMQQQSNVTPPEAHQSFPIPTIYNQNFPNFRTNPQFAGMPRSIRGPNFNIPLNYQQNFSFPNFFSPPQNQFDLSGWY